MNRIVHILLLAAVLTGGPLAYLPVIGHVGTAYASDDDADDADDDSDDDDDDGGNSGSGSNSGSGGGSGSGGNSGPGSSSGSGGSTNVSGGSSISTSSATSATRSVVSRAGKAAPGKDAQNRETFGPELLRVYFVDGHSETVRAGRYEKRNALGQIVEKRAARKADIRHLLDLSRDSRTGGGRKGISSVIEVRDDGANIDVTDSRGWREIVSLSTYVVKDPKGKTVVRRPVTKDDIQRIRATLGID